MASIADPMIPTELFSLDSFFNNDSLGDVADDAEDVFPTALCASQTIDHVVNGQLVFDDLRAHLSARSKQSANCSASSGATLAHVFPNARAELKVFWILGMVVEVNAVRVCTTSGQEWR